MRRPIVCAVLGATVALSSRAAAQDPPADSGSASTDTTSSPAPVAEPPYRIGATLGVVSLPRLLSLEGLLRWKDWGFGASIEYLPPGIMKFGEKTTLSWLMAEAQARYYVYKSIFVGLRVGYQFSRADSEKYQVEVDYVTRSAVVGLRAGVLFTLRSGMALGGDLGVTVPLLPSTSLYSDETEDSNARKAARTFGEFAMPYVSLLRVGYFF